RWPRARRSELEARGSRNTSTECAGAEGSSFRPSYTSPPRRVPASEGYSRLLFPYINCTVAWPAEHVERPDGDAGLHHCGSSRLANPMLIGCLIEVRDHPARPLDRMKVV